MSDELSCERNSNQHINNGKSKSMKKLAVGSRQDRGGVMTRIKSLNHQITKATKGALAISQRVCQYEGSSGQDHPITHHS